LQKEVLAQLVTLVALAVRRQVVLAQPRVFFPVVQAARLILAAEWPEVAAGLRLILVQQALPVAIKVLPRLLITAAKAVVGELLEALLHSPLVAQGRSEETQERAVRVGLAALPGEPEAAPLQPGLAVRVQTVQAVVVAAAYLARHFLRALAALVVPAQNTQSPQAEPLDLAAVAVVVDRLMPRLRARLVLAATGACMAAAVLALAAMAAVAQQHHFRHTQTLDLALKARSSLSIRRVHLLASASLTSPAPLMLERFLSRKT
jgi:hypothetical protein